MTQFPVDAAFSSLLVAIEQSGDGIALFDAQDYLIYANARFRRLLGIDTADSKVWLYSAMLEHGVDQGRLRPFAGAARTLSSLLQMRRQSAFTSYEITSADGVFLVNESLTSDGNLLCLCSSNSRYTELCRELDEQEKLLQQLLLHSSAGIIICDLDNNFRVIDANDAALRVLKYNREELLALDPARLTAPPLPEDNDTLPNERVTDYLTRVMAGDSVTYAWNFRDANDKTIPCMVETIRVHKTGNRWIRCTIHDVSAQHAALQKIATQERHLQHLRHYDPLTELPNRLMLTAQLSLSLQNARLRNTRVALLIIDIDRFKLINDSLGYQIGDQYLVTLSKTLRRLVRDSDAIGRLGADEFAIILEGFGDDSILESKARLILQETASPVKIGEHELVTTVSIGIAIFPDHSTMADDLLRNADAALHLAKQLGKNTFAFYEASLATHLGDQLQLANDLRRALSRNELHLVFQPQIHANTGRIFAAEVLLRWTHATRGFISPAEFIPIAEETGLITDIGQWVLEQSLRQMQLWRDNGITLDYIAVNISPRQFSLDKFVDLVQETTQRCQLSPQCLQLELTENLLLDNSSHTIEKLQRLAASGFSVAIDDFGTGYSSLSYLKRFPLQKLKIDRSFVADVTHDPNDAAIVRAIIAMAGSLNLDVIAEGVETAEQVAFLQALGCNEIQGFYYSKPLAEKAFVDFVKNRA